MTCGGVLNPRILTTRKWIYSPTTRMLVVCVTCPRPSFRCGSQDSEPRLRVKPLSESRHWHLEDTLVASSLDAPVPARWRAGYVKNNLIFALADVCVLVNAMFRFTSRRAVILIEFSGGVRLGHISSIPHEATQTLARKL